MIVSPLSYTVAQPDEAIFAPLGVGRKFSLRKNFASHTKRLEEGKIIPRFDEWPILVDGEDKILSLPPVVISNDLARTTPGTRNILVQVTGTDAETVHNTLKIVVACLDERGGRVYSCLETYSYGSPRRVVSPNLSPTLTRLSLSRINRLLGTSLSLKESARFAEKAGYRAQRASGDTLHLEIPCYRIDIMHPVDMIEDIAIALDLNKMKPEWPRIWTVGDVSAETIETETLGEIMVGLGFQEILTYVLTSPEVVAGRMQMGSGNPVTLLNPKMTTHTVVRNWVLPSLLEFLSRNT